HLGRLKLDRSGNEIDDAFHYEGRFRPTGTTIRRVRGLVGGGDARLDGERIDLVWPGQVHGGVVDDPGADWIPCAAIDDETVAQREDAAVRVEAHLHVVDLVARMARTDQMLAPVLDPLHRPVELTREERNQQVFRIDVPLDAKSAADIQCETAHA